MPQGHNSFLILTVSVWPFTSGSNFFYPFSLTRRPFTSSNPTRIFIYVNVSHIQCDHVFTHSHSDEKCRTWEILISKSLFQLKHGNMRACGLFLVSHVFFFLARSLLWSKVQKIPNQYMYMTPCDHFVMKLMYLIFFFNFPYYIYYRVVFEQSTFFRLKLGSFANFTQSHMPTHINYYSTSS